MSGSFAIPSSEITPQRTGLRDIEMQCGRITAMNRCTITLSPPAASVRPFGRPTVGSTCCDRVVVGEIDVVCCQMRRKWRARIEENCPRSVWPTTQAGSMLLLLAWRGCVMQNQMTADHTLREPDRRLMQLARRPTDNATTVASTGRPKHRSSEANSIILRFTMFLFTRCNTEMVLLNLLQCMPE